MAKSRLTVLSAFSGFGGLDLGLESAGFENVGCIEHDDAARASLASNRPNWRLLEPHDISSVSSSVTARSLGLRRRELSLLAGGPPCQPFSKAAQWSRSGRRGLKDPRSECLRGFFLLVERLLPKVVMIENVSGFVKGNRSALLSLQRRLQRINRKERTNYRLTWSILDAADYGVPQHRERAILVAHRDGKMFTAPSPTHRDRPITAWDALSSLHEDAKSVNENHRGTWLDLLPSIPEGRNYLWHTSRGGGLPLFGYRTRYWSFLLKLAKDRPAWTLAAQPGPYTGPFHWENRRLTEAEALQLQSIPKDWIVKGTGIDRIRQIGNATPSLLAEVLGRAIAGQFFGYTFTDAPKLLIGRATSAAPFTSTREPPSTFNHLVGDWPDHPGAGKGPRPLLVA